MSTYDIPGASVYGQAVELAKKRYQTRLAEINKQRQSTLRQAGFLADVNDETGLTTNVRTDPFNKFGGFQMLNRAQAMRHDETLGANLARGLSSRGGLGAQSLADLRLDFGKEDADFGANLTDALGTLTAQQQEEKYTYDQALYEAMLAAAQSAIEEGDYGYGGGDYGGPAEPDYSDYPPEPELPFIRKSPAGARPTKKPAAPPRFTPKKPVGNRSSGNPMHRGGRGMSGPPKPAPRPAASKPAPRPAAPKPAPKPQAVQKRPSVKKK